MSSPGVRASLIVALASGVLLAGCDKSSEDASAPGAGTPAPTAAPKPTPRAKLADHMVAAVSQGKTANAVGVHFMLGSTPVVNQDLPIEIAVVPHEKFVSLRMNLVGHEGITVVSGDTFGPKTGVEPEKAFTHEVVLRPTSEGVFTVAATVETEGGDGLVSRDYAIPVIVAPRAAPSAGAAPATAPPPQKTPATN